MPSMAFCAGLTAAGAGGSAGSTAAGAGGTAMN